jgi:hypothetical protein
MKRLIALLPAIFLAACASQPPKKIVIVPAIESSHFAAPNSNLRIPEQIREYRFGRYIDPGDRSVMHEAHPVYRVERANTWNLRPERGSGTASLPEPSQSFPANDGVIAEINKQKAATKAFTDQAAGLNQRLADVAQALAQTAQVAKQNLILQQSITSLKTRVDEIETRIRNAPANSKPATVPEENW